MDKKEFVTAALDPKYEIFIVYIVSFCFFASLSSSLLDVHLFYRAQIVDLIAKKALTNIFNKYVDFADVFSSNLASKFS